MISSLSVSWGESMVISDIRGRRNPSLRSYNIYKVLHEGNC